MTKHSVAVRSDRGHAATPPVQRVPLSQRTGTYRRRRLDLTPEEQWEITYAVLQAELCRALCARVPNWALIGSKARALLALAPRSACRADLRRLVRHAQGHLQSVEV